MLSFNIEEEISLLEKYKITPTELFVLRLLLLAKDDSEVTYLYDYFSLPKEVVGNFRELLISLQDKGIILKSYKIPEKGQALNLGQLEINKNVTKNFYKAAYDMGLELFEHYPQFGLINGVSVPLRGVSKKFNSLEDAFRTYGKNISWNPDLHKKIIEIVDWAKDNFPINCSLAAFIVDHKWLDLEAMKNGEAVNYHMDSFTDI